MKEEVLFRIWLFFVGFTRVFAILNGFFNLDLIKKNVYARGQSEVTDLFGRMFSNWNLLSVSLVLCLALYPRNKQVYLLNLVSFTVAFSHMITEMWVFETMGALSAALMTFFAGFTSLWMITRWIIKGQIFDVPVTVDKSKSH
jgi:hypothetical protein